MGYLIEIKMQKFDNTTREMFFAGKWIIPIKQYREHLEALLSSNHHLYSKRVENELEKATKSKESKYWDINILNQLKGFIRNHKHRKAKTTQYPENLN